MAQPEKGDCSACGQRALSTVGLTNCSPVPAIPSLCDLGHVTSPLLASSIKWAYSPQACLLAGFRSVQGSCEKLREKQAGNGKQGAEHSVGCRVTPRGQRVLSHSWLPPSPRLLPGAGATYPPGLRPPAPRNPCTEAEAKPPDWVSGKQDSLLLWSQKDWGSTLQIGA